MHLTMPFFANFLFEKNEAKMSTKLQYLQSHCLRQTFNIQSTDAFLLLILGEFFSFVLCVTLVNHVTEQNEFFVVLETHNLTNV